MRLGLDMVHIPSFEEKLKYPDFVSRVFLPQESSHANADVQHLAGVFAAKEALFKAINGVRGWLDVQVKQTESGPTIVAPIPQGLDVALSITHEKDYACAVVVIFPKEETRFEKR